MGAGYISGATNIVGGGGYATGVGVGPGQFIGPGSYTGPGLIPGGVVQGGASYATGGGFLGSGPSQFVPIGGGGGASYIGSRSIANCELCIQTNSTHLIAGIGTGIVGGGASYTGTGSIGSVSDTSSVGVKLKPQQKVDAAQQALETFEVKR